MKTLKTVLLGLALITIVSAQAQTSKSDQNTSLKADEYRWTQETRNGTISQNQPKVDQADFSFAGQLFSSLFGPGAWAYVSVRWF